MNHLSKFRSENPHLNQLFVQYGEKDAEVVEAEANDAIGVNDNFIHTASALVFNVTMPALLFLGILHADLMRFLASAVVMGGPADARTARTHRLSLVTLDGVRYITDVGFGGMVPSGPLRLDSEEDQATAHEFYRLTHNADDSYTLWAEVAGEWRGLYVFDLQEQADIDYEIGNWYVSTHPGSPFLGQLKVALLAPGKRYTLNNAHYAVHYLDRPSDKHTIKQADELLVLLRETFGIRLPEDGSLVEKVNGLIMASS